MFILSGPYNSSFLGKSLRNINEPVLALPGTKIPFGNSYKINKKDDFEITLSNKKILTSLEDSLDYLNNNFKEHESVKIANLFKNKFLFRDRLARTCVFPKFEYQKIDSPTTITVDYIKNNPKVLKPVSGISSKNVTILNNIKKDFYVEASQNNSYILEKYIHGIELAVDGYYDSSGFPVIINITQHEFFSDSDVSDTLYWTNLKLIQTHIRKIEYLLQDIKTKQVCDKNNVKC
ncbi:MAG: ATP-grasp domain-containing protein, partial [Nanoarchaeota archaeon]